VFRRRANLRSCCDYSLAAAVILEIGCQDLPGIVLRPRGCSVTGRRLGTTTTLATMLNYINENFDRHIGR